VEHNRCACKVRIEGLEIILLFDVDSVFHARVCYDRRRVVGVLSNLDEEPRQGVFLLRAHA
jgi:hypothetical protein